MKLTIAFDVDYTLIGENFEPLYENIELFRWFDKQGHDMVIWSGGGIQYAKHWAEKLGLHARIIEKCSENVDIAVDDAMDFGADYRKNICAKVVITVDSSHNFTNDRLDKTLNIIEDLNNGFKL